MQHNHRCIVMPCIQYHLQASARFFYPLLHAPKLTLYTSDGGISEMNIRLPHQPINVNTYVGQWGHFASNGHSHLVLQWNDPPHTPIPLQLPPTSLSAIYTTSPLNPLWNNYVFISYICCTTLSQAP